MKSRPRKARRQLERAQHKEAKREEKRVIKMHGSLIAPPSAIPLIQRGPGYLNLDDAPRLLHSLGRCR